MLNVLQNKYIKYTHIYRAYLNYGCNVNVLLDIVFYQKKKEVPYFAMHNVHICAQIFKGNTRMHIIQG